MPHQCPPQPPCRGRCPCNAPAPPREWCGRRSSFTRHEKCVLAVIWVTGLLLTGELLYHWATRLGHWEEALHSNWLAKGDHPVSSIQHTPRGLKCENSSSCFQPGEGPSRSLLCDCENRLWNRWIVYSFTLRSCPKFKSREWSKQLNAFIRLLFSIKVSASGLYLSCCIGCCLGKYCNFKITFSTQQLYMTNDERMKRKLTVNAAK